MAAMAIAARQLDRLDSGVAPALAVPDPDSTAAAVAGPASPALSVLVTTWNSATTIEGALDSVLVARWPSLEVVVVDDGSTDATTAIVRAVASRDPRVRLEVLPRNVGVSDARNRGLGLVRGDWLTILDADDRFAADGLERLAAAALEGDALAVVAQQVWTDGRSRWLTGFYDIPAIRNAGRKSVRTDPGLVYFASPHAKVVHRSCWSDLRFEGRVLGDQAWVIRALLRAGDRLDVLGESVYEWHRPPRTAASGSITAASRSSAAQGVGAIAAAGRAFRAVAGEAAPSMGRGSRTALLATYAERLARVDLTVHLQRALSRRDPETPQLIDAATTFLEAVGAEIALSQTSAPADIVAAIAGRWHRLDERDRAAFERLMAAAVDADPALWARPGGWPRRVAVRALQRLPRRLGGPTAQLLLVGDALAGRVQRRLLGRLPPPARSRRDPLAPQV